MVLLKTEWVVNLLGAFKTYLERFFVRVSANFGA